ncbi:MAG: serine/threonine protein kinase, partial [Sphaerospermopsis kisseleviana]
PPTIMSQPVKQKTSTSQPVVNSQTPSQIEKELLEIKTQFTGGKVPSKNANQQSSVTTNNDAIDKELEEMKAKFLDNSLLKY